MADRISPRDLQALSEYLDNQMHIKKRAALEERISKSQELSQALEELRLVKRVLKSQAQSRAPRNFILTPEQVGHHSRPPTSIPVFQLATILAAILLVFFVAGDLFTSSSMRMTQQTEAPAEGLLAEPMSAPVIEQAQEAPAEESSIGEPAMEALMESEQLPGEADEPEMELKAMKAPTDIPAPAQAAPGEQPAEPSGGGVERLAPSEPSLESQDNGIEMETQADLEQQPLAAEPVAEEESPQPVPSFLGITRSWLTIIEIGLALVMVSAAISYIFLKKRSP